MKKQGQVSQALYRRRSGSQLVEFALVFPVLALVLFGILQYGFIFADYITLRNASAAAARQAMINSNNNYSLARSVAQDAIVPLLNSASLTFTPSITNLSSGPATSIKLVYNLKLIIPFVVPGATNGFRKISATTVIR